MALAASAVAEPQVATGVPAEPATAPTAVGALSAFLRAQPLNTGRHAAALRPFERSEFGSGPALPSEAHLQAANDLIQGLRSRLVALMRGLASAATEAAEQSGDNVAINTMLSRKEVADRWVKYVEEVWDFYFELFGQRQSRASNWLLATDRIARDCYQAVYTGLGVARSVPSPPPFSYMRTGFTPATFRRGVPLKKLGQRANPFPIVELPYHRMVNPWTLGAVHHEVSHNLQSDLGLWDEVPRRLKLHLAAAGIPIQAAEIWARWNKEIWADLCGLLLGGPQVVASLMDVVALPASRSQSFNPDGVHPTPYLRVLINLELVRRMGFDEHARVFRRLWDRLYPTLTESTMPTELLDSSTEAIRHVVHILCFEPYPQLGARSLAQVVCFRPTHAAMTEEAAERISRGIDPGIVPARFLVGATRSAIDRRLAPPELIARNFYLELTRR